jgi:hypothetical protein
MTQVEMNLTPPQLEVNEVGVVKLVKQKDQGNLPTLGKALRISRMIGCQRVPYGS